MSVSKSELARVVSSMSNEEKVRKTNFLFGSSQKEVDDYYLENKSDYESRQRAVVGFYSTDKGQNWECIYRAPGQSAWSAPVAVKINNTNPPSITIQGQTDGTLKQLVAALPKQRPQYVALPLDPNYLPSQSNPASVASPPASQIAQSSQAVSAKPGQPAPPPPLLSPEQKGLVAPKIPLGKQEKDVGQRMKEGAAILNKKLNSAGATPPSLPPRKH